MKASDEEREVSLARFKCSADEADMQKACRSASRVRREEVFFNDRLAFDRLPYRADAPQKRLLSMSIYFSMANIRAGTSQFALRMCFFSGYASLKIILDVDLLLHG